MGVSRPFSNLLLPVVMCCLLAMTNARAEEEAQKGPIPVAKVKRKAPVDFNREIVPILTQNCLACHNKTRAKADLVLETPQDMIKGGENGKSIVPKHGSDSLLLKVASHQKKPIMPPRDNKVNAANLTSEELGLLKQWIDEGAKGSTASSAPIEWQPLPSGVNPIYAVSVTPDGQFAACGRANQVFIYDIPTGQLVTRLTDSALLKSGLYGKPGAAHRDMVQSLAFSPDGNLLASGGYRVVKLWRRTQNTRKATLPEADKKDVLAVAASPDGEWYATGGDDGRIRIWDANKNKVARTIKAHKGPITSLKFSPDGSRLLSSSIDKSIRVWELPKGDLFAEVETPAAVNAVAWLADGKRFVSGGEDKLIRVWWLTVDEGDGQIFSLRELKGHDGAVTALDAFTTPATQILSGSSDGSVRIWDADNGQMVKQMNHGGAVNAVAVRLDGKRIASAGLTNVAKLWDPQKGQQVAEMKGDRRLQDLIGERERQVTLVVADVAYWKGVHQGSTNDHNAQVERVKKATEANTAAQKTFTEKQAAYMKAKDAKDAADKALAELNDPIKKATDAFDAADKTAKDAEANLKTVKEKQANNKDAIDKATADSTTKTKAAADAKAALDKLNADNKDKLKAANDAVSNTTKALDPAEKEFKKAEMTKSNTENELQLGQKSEQQTAADVAAALASIQASEAKQKKAEEDLSVAKKAATAGEQAIRALVFSADNLELYTAGDDQLIHTWSAENGTPFDTLVGHGAAIHALALAGKGALVSGAGEHDALVWNVGNEWKLERVIGGEDVTSPLADRVNTLRFSPDGRQLATGGGEPTRGGEIKIWQLSDGKLVQDLPKVHSDTVFGLDYSPDGKYLASASADRFMKVAELATGKVVKSFEGHTHYVMGVSWKRDGRTLASCGADNQLKLWDFVKGDKKRNVEGFGKEVTSVNYLGITDQTIATCGDSQIRAVNEKGENVRSFGGSADFVFTSAVTPDGKILVAGGQDSVLRVWNATNGQSIITFAPPPAPAPAATPSATTAQK